MPDCNITNQTANNVLLRLSSGRTIQLGPHEAALVDVADIRFDAGAGAGRPTCGNPRVARLHERGLIEIELIAPAAKKTAAKKTAARKTATKKAAAKKAAAAASGSPK